MTRAEHRRRLPLWIAAALAFTVMAGWAFADARIPYDDRPPLLASEEVPEGIQPASQLRDVGVENNQQTSALDVVLTADGGLPYQVFELSGPDRLVVDLPGVSSADLAGLRREVDELGLVRVRVGQFRSEPVPVARVVLDMNEPLAWAVERVSEGVRVRVAPDRAALQPSGAPAVAQSSRPAPEPASFEPEPEPTPETNPAAPEPVEEPPVAEPTTPRPEPEPAASIESEPSPAAAAEPSPAERPEPEPASQLSPAPGPGAAEPDAGAESEPAFAAEPEPATEPAAPSGQADELDAALSDSGKAAAPVAAQPAEQEPAPEDPWTDSEITDAIEEASGKTQEQDLPEGVSQPALPGGNASTRSAVPLPNAETKTIDDTRRVYSGERISLQLVDADIKQVFGMFHEISGLNFVLDPAVGGLVTIAVDDVPWDQALDLILKNNGLDMVLEGNVVRIAPIQKLAQEAQARKQLHEAKELEEPPVTITRTLSYAKADDVEQVINQAIVSEKGDVMVDERTNTLVIRDVPARIKAIDGLLETLDAETPQVMIEARIVEISRDFVKDLGIRWGVSAIADPTLGTETNLDFPHRASGSFDLNLPRNPAASSLGFSFGNVLDSFTLDIVLDALETEGYARRLSSPKIATQNNEIAEIEQGVRIPVVSTTATEIDVRFVSASLLLRCTPQITADGTVILEVEVENNSPDFVNTVGEVPAINTQRAQTKVLINDGGTTVIGGIFTVNEGESETGVPWLRNVPGLGWLFRNKNIQTRNRELLIFITPRIIKAS
jgi:type IV pilus assembly protein PilQ